MRNMITPNNSLIRWFNKIQANIVQLISNEKELNKVGKQPSRRLTLHLNVFTKIIIVYLLLTS